MANTEINKIELELPSPAATLARLAGLGAGLEPEESTRIFFQKLLARCAQVLGARRLLIFESRSAGRDPALLAWYGMRPGQPERVYIEVAKTALQTKKLFLPDVEYYVKMELEQPKLDLAGLTTTAYSKTLAALVVASSQKLDPDLLAIVAGQIGLHLFSRQANIKAAGLVARANQNQRLLENLLENMPGAALQVEGQYLRPNRAAAELLGFSSDEGCEPFLAAEIEVLQAQELIHYTEGDSPLNLRREQIAQNELVQIRRRDGEAVALKLTASPVVAEDGRLLGGFIFLQEP